MNDVTKSLVQESIHKKMFRGIFDADVSMVDIRSLNPNVFYELSVRHALHKYITLVIRRNSNLPIPFNVNGLNILEYDTDTADQRENSRKKIRAHIQNGLDALSLDSIVYDALDNLKVEGRSQTIDTREEKLYQVVGAPGKQIGYITGNIKNINNVDIWSIPKTPTCKWQDTMTFRSLPPFDMRAQRKMETVMLSMI